MPAQDSPKSDYLFRFIVAPLCRSQYQILIEYLRSPRLFADFDKRLKQFPTIYRSHLVSGKIIGVHRVTGGVTIACDGLFRKIGRIFKDFETK